MRLLCFRLNGDSMAFKTFMITLFLVLSAQAVEPDQALSPFSTIKPTQVKTYLIPSYDLAAPELFSMSTYLLELTPYGGGIPSGTFKMLNVNAHVDMYDGAFLIKNGEITLVLVGVAQVKYDKNTLKPISLSHQTFKVRTKMHLRLEEGTFGPSAEFVGTPKDTESTFELTIEANGQKNISRRSIYFYNGTLDEYLGTIEAF